MGKAIKKLLVKQKGTVAILSVMLALSFLLSSCEKNSDLNGDNKLIYGKWQLKTMRPLDVEEDLIPTLPDLSIMNIIFEFKANNILTVSSDNADFNTGFEVGNHYYDVTLTNISNGLLITDSPQHIVEINKNPYGFSLGEVSVDNALFLACGGECNRLLIFIEK